jgi:hypothetical protein
MSADIIETGESALIFIAFLAVGVIAFVDQSIDEENTQPMPIMSESQGRVI